MGVKARGGRPNHPPWGMPKVGETDDLGPVCEASALDDAETAVLDKLGRSLGPRGLTPGETWKPLEVVSAAPPDPVNVGKSVGPESVGSVPKIALPLSKFVSVSVSAEKLYSRHHVFGFFVTGQ